MGVEHEVPWIAEPRLDDRALALAEHQRVGDLARREREVLRPEHVEEHPVKVQAVDQIELGDVDQIDPNELADLTRTGSCMK